MVKEYFKLKKEINNFYKLQNNFNLSDLINEDDVDSIPNII